MKVRFPEKSHQKLIKEVFKIFGGTLNRIYLSDLRPAITLILQIPSNKKTEYIAKYVVFK